MSKALDELKKIELKWQYGVFTFIPNFKIIEKELKRLEKIDDLFAELGLDEKSLPIWHEMQLEDGKKLNALEIIKDFVWVENGEIHIGLYGDSEIVLRENDFESKDKYDLLKEVLL